MTDVYVFRPRWRILFDWILYLGVIHSLLGMMGVSTKDVLIALFLAFLTVLVIFWFVVIRPTFEITIKSGKIYGPTPHLRRISFPLRRVNHTKILRRTSRQKFIGYRDLWSIDQDKIRLCHRLLGKTAIYSILEIVEKYPFREQLPQSES